MGDGLEYLIGALLCLIVLNGVVTAAITILRAASFGKGNVVGATHHDMSTYRAGIAARAFVSDRNWCRPGDRRRAFVRRWVVFFPVMVLRRFGSLRFWGWCALEGILLFVLWLNWRQS